MSSSNRSQSVRSESSSSPKLSSFNVSGKSSMTVKIILGLFILLAIGIVIWLVVGYFYHRDRPNNAGGPSTVTLDVRDTYLKTKYDSTSQTQTLTLSPPMSKTPLKATYSVTLKPITAKGTRDAVISPSPQWKAGTYYFSFGSSNKDAPSTSYATLDVFARPAKPPAQPPNNYFVTVIVKPSDDTAKTQTATVQGYVFGDPGKTDMFSVSFAPSSDGKSQVISIAPVSPSKLIGLMFPNQLIHVSAGSLPAGAGAAGQVAHLLFRPNFHIAGSSASLLADGFGGIDPDAGLC